MTKCFIESGRSTTKSRDMDTIILSLKPYCLKSFLMTIPNAQQKLPTMTSTIINLWCFMIIETLEKITFFPSLFT